MAFTMQKNWTVDLAKIIVDFVQAANISSMGFASSSEDSIKIHKQLDNPI
jgi:hypothetical protein